ncbi:MAG TPA: hypothetical protein VFA54_13645 [Bryobacterales bacterium]|nr:hypothetical protein [Bryobacterales bacterium]
MSTRTFLAGLLGGVTMFVWMFIAHMVLPLGEAGVKEMPNESPVLSSMQASMGAGSGVYVFPGTGLPPNATADQRNAAMRDYNGKLAASPSGFLVYHGPGATFSFPKLLGTEFALEVAEALLAAWLLSMTVLKGLMARAGFVTVVGVIAAIATNVSYWNWYGFSGTYTAAYVFTQAAGFLCAGLVMAALVRGKGGLPARAVSGGR